MRRKILLRTALILICMSAVAAIYTFVVIPSVKEKERAAFERFIDEAEEHDDLVTVLIYNGKTPLFPGTVITESTEQYFTSEEIPENAAVYGYVSDPDKIYGMQVRYTICEGQQISMQSFKKYIYEYEGGERLKDFNIQSLVAGQAMPGRYVDIMLIYPDGRTAVVVPKIQICDIVTERVNGTDVNSVVFAVNDREYSDLINAEYEGRLDIRVYIDVSQDASLKTYVPGRMTAGAGAS